MIAKALFLLVPALLFPPLIQAQQGEGSSMVEVRAILHDPVRPAADLYLTNKVGGIAKLNLAPACLSPVMQTMAVNGSLVLYDKQAVDPKNPQASLAATAKLPANAKRVIAVIFPGPEGAKPAYRMILLDDSPTGFPKGESRVVSLIPVETAIQAGEHKVPVKPGVVTPVPAVKKVNEFNMAQLNFYFKNGENWVAFTERQVQFLNEFRRIFIVYVTPGSTQPFVATIVDTAQPPAAPQP